MPGIIISEIENIDKDGLTQDEIDAKNAQKLRESVQSRYNQRIQARKKLLEEQQNKRAQTGVSVTNTPSGVKTEIQTTNPKGNTTTTIEDHEADLDEVNQNVESEIDGAYDETWLDEEQQEGNDVSDVKVGEEDLIPYGPAIPQEDAKEATKNSNSPQHKNGEVCTTDEEESEVGSKKEDGETKSEEPAIKVNCTDPDSTGLNDLQKQIIWVALDMLKWQPEKDLSSERIPRGELKGQYRKRRWFNIKKGDAFYKKFPFPKSPSFEMHDDMDVTAPLHRLKTLFNQTGKNLYNTPSPYGVPWCAETASVIYATAMASLRVKHKTITDKGTSVRLNKYKDKRTQIPFYMNNNSAEVCLLNAEGFNYNTSWEPTIGALKFVTYAAGDGAGGHVAIVIDVLEDKRIIVAEGNGASDYSIRVWPRDFYYETSWKRMEHKKEPSGYGPSHPAAPPNSKHNRGPRWRKVMPPWPTKSVWHSPFVNPSISKDLIWTDTVSREGNPLDEVKKLLNTFWNPEGSKGSYESGT